MASSVRLTGELKLTALYADGNPGGVSQRITLGAGPVPEAAVELANGTGSAQFSKLHWSRTVRTLAATTGESINLTSGLADAGGVTLAFAAVKLLLVLIDTPDGTKSLRVGPQAVANAWLLPWGHASGYTTLTDWGLLVYQPWAGVAVTASTADLLRVYNPGAGSVSYRLLIGGV